MIYETLNMMQQTQSQTNEMLYAGDILSRDNIGIVALGALAAIFAIGLIDYFRYRKPRPTEDEKRKKYRDG